MTATLTERLATADTGACGTSAGYQRHRKAGTPPCRPCLDATNEERKSVHMDEESYTTALAVFMPTRPDLTDLPFFGATLYTGQVMNA